MNEVLANIGDGIAWLIGFPLLAFIIQYPARSSWRTSPLGIERELKNIYLFALWLLIMAGNFLPDEFETARLIARIVVFSAVVVGLTIQYVNLTRVQTLSDKPLIYTWLTYQAQHLRKAARQLRKARKQS